MIQKSEILAVGHPFRLYKRFPSLHIPEQLARSRLFPPGAKLVYGRLQRYAGKDGHCFPSIAKLAAEVGLGERQVQKHLGLLEEARLIRRIRRFAAGGAQTSNAYEFLWHEVFEASPNSKRSSGRVTSSSPSPVHASAPKESPLEESHEEEKDLDYMTSNRRRRDSQSRKYLRESQCKRYPEVARALAEYMHAPDEDWVEPSDQVVVEVMHASGGASESEVITCLRYLYYERGLRPEAKFGPRTFPWFKTVVKEYFDKQRSCDQVTGAPDLSGNRGVGEKVV